MHTYRKAKDEPFFTVGYWIDGKWMAIKDFNVEANAVMFVNILNGGDPEFLHNCM